MLTMKSRDAYRGRLKKLAAKYYNPETGEEEEISVRGDWTKGDARVRLRVELSAEIVGNTVAVGKEHMVKFSYKVVFVNQDDFKNLAWLSHELTRVFEQACPSSGWNQGFKHQGNVAEFEAERSDYESWGNASVIMTERLESFVANLHKTLEARGNALIDEYGSTHKDAGKYISKSYLYDIKKGF